MTNPGRPILSAFRSMLMVLAVACAGCGGGGAKTAVVYLAANAPCFGVGIDVPAFDAASAGDVSCELDENVAGAGCTLELDSSGDPVRIRVRGCFAEAGRALLSCSGSGRFEQALTDSAVVRCGCGCSQECPEAPSVVVCDEGDADCAMQAAVSVANLAPAAARRTIDAGDVQATTTTSSTTYCGTCCDVFFNPDVYLDSPEQLSELEFEVYVPSGEPLCPDISCVVDPEISGPTSYHSIDDEHLRICVASASMLDGPRSIAYCGVQSDGADELTFLNVKALDRDWKPVEPAPSLSSILF